MITWCFRAFRWMARLGPRLAEADAGLLITRTIPLELSLKYGLTGVPQHMFQGTLPAGRSRIRGVSQHVARRSKHSNHICHQNEEGPTRNGRSKCDAVTRVLSCCDSSSEF